MHSMEDSARRRHIHSEKSDVWVPPIPIDEDEGKDVYGKAKAGFHTGRLGPVRRQQPPPANIVSRMRARLCSC